MEVARKRLDHYDVLPVPVSAYVGSSKNLKDLKDPTYRVGLDDGATGARSRQSCPLLLVGGGVRIHPGNARKSGRHGVQCVAQCVACAALTLVVWQ